VTRNFYKHTGKRLFDLALASIGVLFFALPMLWISWRTWATLGKPVLFHQIRVGREGTHFMVHKFRTMTTDGAVSPYGKKLRASALDELPQLFNILKGDMGFVGPRALIPEELDKLDKLVDGLRRLSIRPGLAGLAQLRCAKVPHLPERLKWDLVYLDRYNFKFDLWIILQSIGFTLRSAWDKPSSPSPTGGSHGAL